MKFPIVTASAMLLLLLSGCSGMFAGRSASQVITSQKGGESAGAGGTMTSPNNAASPSTQVSERWADFFAPTPAAVIAAPDVPVLKIEVPRGPMELPAVEPFAPLPTPNPSPQLARVYERSATQLGAHQDAGGILKIAAEASKLGVVRAFGLIGMLVAIGGYLYSANNDKSGYPLVWILTGCVGLMLTVVGGSAGLLAWYLIPLGFYGVQKFGLLKLPG